MNNDLSTSLNNLTIKAAEATQMKQPIVHCGDLSLKTTSSELKSIFGDFNVTNIVLKKTPNNQYSFAFVYLDTIEAVEEAVETLNYTQLHEKEIIMTVYDPQNRYKDESNVFVNNLPEEMAAKDLDAIFQAFGTIVSCKISTDPNGKSKGYGFVNYKSSKSAKKAVASCKNVKIGDNALVVELFDSSKCKRNVSHAVSSSFTNCFVKNFPPSYTKEKLKELLEKYGGITEIYFPEKFNGMSVGFACANFEKPENALKAINELHNKRIFTNEEMEKDPEFTVEPFYIQKAEKKKDRIDSFKEQANSNLTTSSKLKKNLYIKNVPETFSREEILSVLKEFGEITDIYLAKDTLHPTKQYGFVCYATLEEAAVALERSRQVLLDGNQLELLVYKNKYERDFESNASNDMPASFSTTKSEGLKEEHRKKLVSAIIPIASQYAENWKKVNASDQNEFAEAVAESLVQLSPEIISTILESTSELKNQISLTCSHFNG